MNVVQSLMERLRPLVGLKSWDYCVLWKLSEDQRFIESICCCCGGSENNQNNGEELLYPVSHVLPCRDFLFQHPRTKHCDLLAQLPSSMPLDSGIYTQTLISKQPRWINNSTSLDSSVPDETVGTRVLIPVHGGLIELFAAQNVSENQQIIELVMAQCNHSWEQEPMVESSNRDTMLDREFEGSSTANGFSANGFAPKNTNNHIQPWETPLAVADNLNLPWDLSAHQIRLCNSPMNFFGGSGQQFPTSENRPKNKIFYEGSNDSIMSDNPTTPFNFSGENGFQEMVSLQPSLFTTATNLHLPITDSSMNNGFGHDKDSIKDEMGRADSGSDCSDQLEDDNDQKVVGRTGRKHQSKNLVAERKRRKKLNDRLYALRSLVPKITKMDRASILGDAIEFVKDLQRQVKNLQNELEEQSDEEGYKNGGSNSSNNDLHSEILTPNGISHGANPEHDEALNGLQMGVMDNGTRCSSSPKPRDPSKQNHDNAITEDKAQQMEVQVEVAQIDGNEFFLKVFCEHKPGGFVRLMEALNSLSLEVTNANVTTFRGLVLNVFKIEKRDSEMVQADHVRNSLLELTRNPTGGWSEPVQASSEIGGIMDYHHPHNHHIASHLHHFHSKA